MFPRDAIPGIKGQRKPALFSFGDMQNTESYIHIYVEIQRNTEYIF